MKRLLATIAAVAFVATAQANDRDAILETCTTYSNVAETIMTQRQNGVSMAEMMRRADGDETLNAMVMSAYEEPRYQTSEVKQRTIGNFADAWYLQCARYLETM